MRRRVGSTRRRGNHMHDHSRYQRDINDVTGVSLSLSLSLCLSQKSLTHNIGSASALPIILDLKEMPYRDTDSIIFTPLLSTCYRFEEWTCSPSCRHLLTSPFYFSFHSFQAHTRRRYPRPSTVSHRATRTQSQAGLPWNQIKTTHPVTTEPLQMKWGTALEKNKNKISFQ